MVQRDVRRLLRRSTPRGKIRNREYSQWVGREKLFEGQPAVPDLTVVLSFDGPIEVAQPIHCLGGSAQPLSRHTNNCLQRGTVKQRHARFIGVGSAA